MNGSDMESQSDQPLLSRPIVVNIGVRDFAETLVAQGVDVVHVDWSPPAGGDKELAALLDKLL